MKKGKVIGLCPLEVKQMKRHVLLIMLVLPLFIWATSFTAKAWSVYQNLSEKRIDGWATNGINPDSSIDLTLPIVEGDGSPLSGQVLDDNPGPIFGKMDSAGYWFQAGNVIQMTAYGRTEGKVETETSVLYTESEVILLHELYLDTSYPVSVSGSWKVQTEGPVGPSPWLRNFGYGKVMFREEEVWDPGETVYFWDVIDSRSGSGSDTFFWEGVLDPGLYAFDLYMQARSDSTNVLFEGNALIELTSATVRIGEIPIPGAVWLLGTGLLGLIVVRKKIKK
jgi:hypothetical protein